MSLFYILIIVFLQNDSCFKLDLKKTKSINQEVNGKFKYYNLPHLEMISFDTLFYSSYMYNGNMLYKVYKGEVIDKIEIIGTYYSKIHKIITGLKYIRIYNKNKLYFFDKSKFKHESINLGDLPSIKLNKYNTKMKKISYNFGSLYELSIIHDTIYKGYISKFGLTEIDYVYRNEVDFIEDVNTYWMNIYSRNYATAFIVNSKRRKYSLKDYYKIKRNTIFAFYGRKFKTKWLQEYFVSKPWYKINTNYNSDMLNKFDKEEIQLYVALETKYEK